MNDLMTKIDVIQFSDMPILVTQTIINSKPTGAETDLIISTPAVLLEEVQTSSS